MRVIIIEDEGIALRKLRKLINEIDSQIDIIAELESVYDAKKWLSSNSLLDIDLLFSDIQLSDGLSFEIFENIDLRVPIIFTTAYDEYTLNAFKLNGVDYLLKPIQKEELKNAIHKFEHIRQHYAYNPLSDFQGLINQFKSSVLTYPSFLCYQKEKILPISSENVSVFYIKNLIVYAVVDKTEYVLQESLDDIEKRLPSQHFFRANRQFIVQKKQILNAEIYFNNRLLVHSSAKIEDDIIVSRERASLFKKWLMS